MAQFPREQGAASRIPLISFSTEKDGRIATPVLRSMYLALDQVVTALAGRLSLGTGVDGAHTGHLDWQARAFTAPSVADTAFEVAHGLGRTPIGYVVIYQSLPGSLYADVSRGWTDEMVYLKSDAADAAFRVLLI
jgi:hypothetical protein